MDNRKSGPGIIPGQYREIDQKDSASKEGLPDFETIQTALRLLLGAASLGADEVSRRLKERRQDLNSVIIDGTQASPDETDFDRLRFALIGALAQTPEVMTDSYARARRVSDKATGLASKVLGPIARSRLMRPARQRYQTAVSRGESMVAQWIELGRAEEQAGRILATQTTQKTVDEVVEYLAQKPEIRNLVQQQTKGLAGEFLDAMQTRSAEADTLLERIVRAALRMPPRQSPVTGNLQLPSDSGK